MNKWSRSAWAATCLLFLMVHPVFPEENRPLSRDLLIDDVRELADLVEAVHPDPYTSGGGKIAFHRRLQETMALIPERGMTTEEFYRHLRPFVAAIGDAHTWLRDPYHADYFRPGGIPLRFGIVEDTLYVAATPDQNADLLGKRLVAVEGVPFEELVARQAHLIGAENKYLLLRHLAGWVLWQKCFLEHLIPEWKDKGRVRVVLRDTAGEAKEHVLDIPRKMKYPLAGRPSKIELPSRKKCDFVYDFLDDTRQTALLVVDDMTGFREVFEYDRTQGRAIDVDRARELHKRFHGKWIAPRDEQKFIAELPSATEVFLSLVKEMKEAGTKRLLIDLRNNDGGSSAMSDILIYLLHGKDKLLKLKAGRMEVRKLSPRYFETHRNASIERMNKGKPFPLRSDDYDFGADHYARLRGESKDTANLAEEFESEVSRMPTFYEIYRNGHYSGHYRPPQIAVVCSPDTFSSGWTLMYYLHRGGAIIVGTPSSQGPNCFGEVLGFRLTHSGLDGTVSQKRFEYFPDSPEKGRVLMPDHVLRYEKLAEYDFDPNAEILYALEVLDELERQETIGIEDASGHH